MVAAYCTSSPVTGCVQIFSASDWMAALSSPRGRGSTQQRTNHREPKAGPQSGGRLNRFFGHHISSKKVRVKELCETLYEPDQNRRRASSAGLSRSSETLISKPFAVEIGERKQRSFLQPSRSSPAWTNASRETAGTPRFRKRERDERGLLSRTWSAENVRSRNLASDKWSRRSAPKSSVSSRTRRGVGPCRIAATRMTTAPRYTLRPRNRTDGGVTRFRQPSRAQQKLRR